MQSDLRKRVAVHTLGCKANQADSCHLEGRLRTMGYRIVPGDQCADFYIINTCAVTAEAERQSRQITRRVKRQNPVAKVIVTGCYAQTNSKELAALNSVDQVVGNDYKESVPHYLDGAPKPEVSGQKSASAPKKINCYGYSESSSQSRAFVKIQDGCNQGCSYCIVPMARGTSRSLDMEQVVDELHKLRRHGFKEAVLTGIHIGRYGTDRHSNLLDLLRILEKEKPLDRLRLSSLDPEEISDDMIDCVAQSEMICPHFHIPLQSGDNDILTRMRRRYSSQDFCRVVERIMTVLPDAAIGTDVIVGFPGESEAQSTNTYQLIDSLPLAYLHVFPYSKRPGTDAARYPDQIAASVKKERAARLRELGRHKKQVFYQSFVGRSLDVIVEGKSHFADGLLKGLTRNYIPVFFNGNVVSYRSSVSVTIDRVLKGRVLGHAV